MRKNEQDLRPILKEAVGRGTVLNTTGAESTSRKSKGCSGYGCNAKQDQGRFSESSKDARISIKESLLSQCWEAIIFKQN